jgi:hypothetical protein
MIKQYVNKLMDNLPDYIKNTDNPLKIDLVLDGGVFNGSYLAGALYFLKEMEKRKYIIIERISGCSIGSIAGFLYIMDRLDLITNLYEEFNKEFKETYSLNIIKYIKSNLIEFSNEENSKKINNKLYITYYNIIKGVKKVKSQYKNWDELSNTLIKSCFFPYLVNGNLLYKNKYLDGISPYIFNEQPGRKILYMELFSSDKISGIINIKNEKTNHHRILTGLLDIHNFFIKDSRRTVMCCYVNEWNLFDKFYYKLKSIFEKFFTYIIYFIVIIKKHVNIEIKNTIYYKLISRISYDVFTILLETYCL